MRRHLSRVAVLAVAFAATAPARAADETPQYRVDPAHHNAVPDTALRPPLRVRWEADIGETPSNAVVAGGKVFVVGWDRVRATLYAFDGAGQVVWTRELSTDVGDSWGLAYADGRLFVARMHLASGHLGRLTAVDAANGTTIWDDTLNEEYGITAMPTVVDGTVYVVAASGGARLYAIRGSDGAQVWVSGYMNGQNDSTPTVDSNAVYLAFAGPQVYAISRASGQTLWHYQGCCTGGGGTTGVVSGSRLYEVNTADTPLIHDTATGSVIGSFPAHGVQETPPTFAGDLTIFNRGDALLGVGADGSQRWSYPSHNQYTALGSPIAAGGYAYFGEIPREVTVVDLATGQPVWCGKFADPSWGQPYDGPSPTYVGNGMLVMTLGYGIVALEGGGSPSACFPPTDASQSQPGSGPGSGGSPPGGAVGGAGGTLTLTAHPADIRRGRSSKLTGALTGTSPSGGRSIVIESDVSPFGSFKRLATVRTALDGSFSLPIRPRRNTRYRALLAGGGVQSSPVPVYADYRISIQRLRPRSQRPALRVAVFDVPRHATIRRTHPVFYLGHGGSALRRVGQSAWQHLGQGGLVATVRYPAGRLGRGDHPVVCTREVQSDGYGRPSGIDRICGQRIVPLSALRHVRAGSVAAKGT
jgi:outer membrane protein assembly factor BamB